MKRARRDDAARLLGAVVPIVSEQEDRVLSPEQIEWHEKVRNTLNAEVRNPNFVLSIDVQPNSADDEATGRA